MLYISTTLLLAVVATFTPVKAQDAVNINPGNERPLQRKVTNMKSVSLGEHSKLTVLPSERERIRKFYRDVLGCPMTKESEKIDIFRIGTAFYLGVVYDDAASSGADRLKSIWLELRTAHPEELKHKILKFGINETEFSDKEHFYFQAPGGQVFRLVGTTEDMSKWQQ